MKSIKIITDKTINAISDMVKYSVTIQNYNKSLVNYTVYKSFSPIKLLNHDIYNIFYFRGILFFSNFGLGDIFNYFTKVFSK